MTLEAESAQRIIEHTPDALSVKERFNLPAGFITEKGSTYRYTDQGQVQRHKFDGTDHEKGIAVFLPDSAEGDSMGVRISYALNEDDTSKPKRSIRIAERVVDETTGEAVGRFRTRTEDIIDPANVGVILIEDDRVVEGVGVSLIPEVGTSVLEIGISADGSTIVHPGHKVTSIIQ